MGLKPYRDVTDGSQDFFINHTADRGGIVCLNAFGSGIANDQAAATVHYDSTPSGAVPFGLLTQDVVNKDLTQQPYNQHKDEVQTGGKVYVVTRGVFVTNYLTSAITVSAGDKAYLGTQGQITNVNTGAVASPIVGKFLSSKDEEGYAKVKIEL